MDDKASKSKRPGRPKTIDLEASEVVRQSAGTGHGIPDIGAAEAESRLNTEPAGQNDGQVASPPHDGVAEQGETGASATNAAAATEPGPQPASPRPAPATARSGGSFFGRFLAAVVGGFISLAGLGALSASGIVQAIPGLGTLFGTAQSANGADPALLASRIEALDQQLAALQAREVEPGSPATDDTRLAGLDTRLAAAETAIDGLRQQAAAQTPVQPGNDAVSVKLIALASRLEATEKAMAAIASQPTGASNSTTASADLAATLERSVDSFESALQGNATKMTSLEQRVSALENSAAGLEGAARQQADAGRNAALLVAGSALRSALENGQPYAELLVPIRALAGQNPALAALEPMAQAGVATKAALLAGFEIAAQSMASAEAQSRPPADSKSGGIIADLIANARALVKVEPEGPVEGDTPNAVFSRIRASLEAGEFETASGLLAQLPDELNSHFADWKAVLETKITAHKALAELLLGLAGKSDG